MKTFIKNRIHESLDEAMMVRHQNIRSKVYNMFPVRENNDMKEEIIIAILDIMSRYGNKIV